MSVQRGSTVTSDGVEICWESSGAGLPVVLVHGITEHRGLMAPLAQRFSTIHRVVSLDIRGHGESAHNGNLGIDRLIADVVEVCADLALQEPVLVGHSLGGLMVTGAAAPAGASAVVNIDQPLQLNELAGQLSAIADALTAPDTFHQTLAAVFAGLRTVGLDTEIQTEIDRCVATADRQVVLGVWGPMLAGPDAAVEEQVEGIVRSLTMPYLVYSGSDLGPLHEQWLTELAADVEVETHDGEGHFLHLLQPDRFVERVERFLASRGLAST